MSMEIGAANYLNSTYPSREEKHVQKQPAADAGKTQQSPMSASLDQVNMGQDGAAITQAGRQQGTAQSEQSAPRRDTVDISQQGRAASAKLQKQQTSSVETEQYEMEDLSEYTDSELKQMYYRGEITRQEYMDETGDTLE